MSKTESIFPFPKVGSSLLINETMIHKVRKLKGIPSCSSAQTPIISHQNNYDMFLTGHPESAITHPLYTPFNILVKSNPSKAPKAYRLKSELQSRVYKFFQYFCSYPPSKIKSAHTLVSWLLHIFLLFSYVLYSADNTLKN